MLARISESAAEHLQVNEERSPVGNWNGSVKNTICWQILRCFVIKKSIRCTTIVKYACLPFAILVSEKTKSLRILELVVLRPFENSDPL